METPVHTAVSKHVHFCVHLTPTFCMPDESHHRLVDQSQSVKFTYLLEAREVVCDRFRNRIFWPQIFIPDQRQWVAWTLKIWRWVRGICKARKSLIYFSLRSLCFYTSVWNVFPKLDSWFAPSPPSGPYSSIHVDSSLFFPCHLFSLLIFSIVSYRLLHQMSYLFIWYCLFLQLKAKLYKLRNCFTFFLPLYL